MDNSTGEWNTFSLVRLCFHSKGNNITCLILLMWDFKCHMHLHFCHFSSASSTMLGWIVLSFTFFFSIYFSLQQSTVHVIGAGDIAPAALLFTQKSHLLQRLPVPLKWDILSWGINWMNQTQRCGCCFSLAMPSNNNTFMLLSQQPALIHQPHLSQEHEAGGLLRPRSGLGGWDKECLAGGWVGRWGGGG